MQHPVRGRPEKENRDAGGSRHGRKETAAVLRAFCDMDPTRLKALEVRFSGVVFPGETIITELWKNGPGELIVQAKTKERGEVVISAASATIA